MNSVETGKQLEAKTILKVTKETYKDRNINFREYSKSLMSSILKNKEFKTLNLEAKTYGISLRLTIVPVVIKGNEIIVANKKIIVPAERKIELAKKKIDEAKKLIRVVK